MIRLALLSTILISSGPAAVDLNRQVVCREPTTNEWLREAPAANRSGFTQVDPSLVVAVTSNVSSAIGLLSHDEVVAITPQQVRRFTGLAGRLAGTPYLVRAVFPTSRPSVSVSVHGTDLYVFAGGLGCAPYQKQPLVVFLDARPTDVFVAASAAL